MTQSAKIDDDHFEPVAGAKVAARYVLVEELARGGMGTVWLAEDPKLRRPVAIKLLTSDWVTNESSRRRFEREAMAVAQLQCPQVVQIFDYGVERSVPYIVMERLVGEDLRVRLKRERMLSLDEAAHIVWQVAKALAAAHASGIIHRDLKPGNVFLVPQGEEEIAKVLDFGVAKTEQDSENQMPRALVGTPLKKVDVSTAEATKAGTILGTPQYMSPEQGRGNVKLDHRSDLWSLGVIAYRMVTGKLPFTGKNAAEVIVSVITSDHAPPTSIAPNLSPEVDAFFERALAKKPDERFASAKELARALRSITGLSLPTISMPDPRAPLSSDWDRSGRFTPYGADISGRFTPQGADSGRFTPGAPISQPISQPVTGPSAAFAPPSSRTRPTGERSEGFAPDSQRAFHAESTLESAALGSEVEPAARPGEPAAPVPRPRRRGWVLLLLLLGLIAGGAGVFLHLAGAEPSPTETRSAGPSEELGITDEGSASANEETTEGAGDEETGTEASPAAEPSATASAPPTAEPTAMASAEESPPKRPRPVVVRPRPPRPVPPKAPPPPPPPQTAIDPFADRH